MAAPFLRQRRGALVGTAAALAASAGYAFSYSQSFHSSSEHRRVSDLVESHSSLVNTSIFSTTSRPRAVRVAHAQSPSKSSFVPPTRPLENPFSERIKSFKCFGCAPPGENSCSLDLKVRIATDDERHLPARMRLRDTQETKSRIAQQRKDKKDHGDDDDKSEDVVGRDVHSSVVGFESEHSPVGSMTGLPFAKETVLAFFRPLEDKHCSFPHVVHGGLLTAAMDDVAYFAVFASTSALALTQTAKVRFRAPARPGQMLCIRARVTDLDTDKNRVRVRVKVRAVHNVLSSAASPAAAAAAGGSASSLTKARFQSAGTVGSVRNSDSGGLASHRGAGGSGNVGDDAAFAAESAAHRPTAAASNVASGGTSGDTAGSTHGGGGDQTATANKVSGDLSPVPSGSELGPVLCEATFFFALPPETVLRRVLDLSEAETDQLRDMMWFPGGPTKRVTTR